MKIIVDGQEWIPSDEEAKAVRIEMWYDRSRKEWVLYPVDAEGNQMAEASYGFGKKDAMRIKADLESEWLA